MDFKIPKILSMSDVAQLEICKGGACSDLPQEELLTQAYSVGLDVKKGYEFREGLHRNLQNKIVGCSYLCSEERTDREWLDSGYASIEAHIYSTKDKSMVKVLEKSMNAGYSLHDSLANQANKPKR